MNQTVNKSRKTIIKTAHSKKISGIGCPVASARRQETRDMAPFSRTSAPNGRYYVKIPKNNIFSWITHFFYTYQTSKTFTKLTNHLKSFLLIWKRRTHHGNSYTNILMCKYTPSTSTVKKSTHIYILTLPKK